jgi:hypothetical protein
VARGVYGHARRVQVGEEPFWTVGGAASNYEQRAHAVRWYLDRMEAYEAERTGPNATTRRAELSVAIERLVDLAIPIEEATAANAAFWDLRGRELRGTLGQTPPAPASKPPPPPRPTPNAPPPTPTPAPTPTVNHESPTPPAPDDFWGRAKQKWETAPKDERTTIIVALYAVGALALGAVAIKLVAGR